MKNPLLSLALYTATILISALPFAMDVADVKDEIKKQHTAEVNNVKLAVFEQHEKYGHDNLLEHNWQCTDSNQVSDASLKLSCNESNKSF